MEHAIVFTKKQYQTLINAIQVADSVYGIMGDMVDKKYKKQSEEMDDLERHVLNYAEQFGMVDIVEEHFGHKHIADGKMEEFMDDLLTFEDYAMWDNLARRLAERDMERIYSPKQLEEMEQMRYIELESAIEENYHKEFEKNGLVRVEIKK